MEIKELDNSNRIEFENLLTNIKENLINLDFFVPITNDELDMLFDKTKCIILGAYEDNKLIGVTCLCLSMNWYENSFLKANLPLKSVGCVEHCMVHSNYRGKNIMLTLNLELVKIAKSMGVEYLTATAHPNNIASVKSLSKLGLKKIDTILRDGYLRDVFYIKT